MVMSRDKRAKSTLPGPGPQLHLHLPRPGRMPAPVLEEDLEKVQKRMEQTEKRDRGTARPLPMHELKHSKQRIRKLINRLEREIDAGKLEEWDMYNAIVNLSQAKETLLQLEQKTASDTVASKVAARYVADQGPND